ncbi:MAG: hypothetical protein KJ066_13530 [Acidobacteria bacterium]|nr:hypothetical protein [Acidobacteriota bacterium]
MTAAHAQDLPLFTVGVFKDLESAGRALAALGRQGFAPEVLSVVAPASPEAVALVEQATGAVPARLAIKGIGEALAGGPLVAALGGPGADLGRLGLSATMRRVGFQPHDGHIFETLTARGGVLVAVRSTSRASDAIETLHNHGGGNAAIGAWHGRI